MSAGRMEVFLFWCVWFDSDGLPPLTGASPPYPHLLSFTGKKVRQRKRTVAAAYARLERRFFEKSLAKTSICIQDVWKFYFHGKRKSAKKKCGSREFLAAATFFHLIICGKVPPVQLPSGHTLHRRTADFPP